MVFVDFPNGGIALLLVATLFFPILLILQRLAPEIDREFITNIF